VQATEQCDDGERNADDRPDACRVSCARPACGDGVIDQGEQCDGGDLCSSQCKAVSSWEAFLDRSHLNGTLGIVLLSGVEALTIGVLLWRFRKRGGLGKLSFEDIPLSELENPGTMG